jgi:hypothetical protein
MGAGRDGEFNQFHAAARQEGRRIFGDSGKGHFGRAGDKIRTTRRKGRAMSFQPGKALRMSRGYLTEWERMKPSEKQRWARMEHGIIKAFLTECDKRWIESERMTNYSDVAKEVLKEYEVKS